MLLCQRSRSLTERLQIDLDEGGGEGVLEGLEGTGVNHAEAADILLGGLSVLAHSAEHHSLGSQRLEEGLVSALGVQVVLVAPVGNGTLGDTQFCHDILGQALDGLEGGSAK